MLILLSTLAYLRSKIIINKIIKMNLIEFYAKNVIIKRIIKIKYKVF